MAVLYEYEIYKTASNTAPSGDTTKKSPNQQLEDENHLLIYDENGNCFLKFTTKEIQTMPKDFKKIFMVEKMIARVYKRTSRNTLLYDIKLRRDGFNISVTAKTLEEAKSKFLEKLKNYEAKATKEENNRKTFEGFANYYFDNYHKRKVSESYYRKTKEVMRIWINPVIGNKPIDKITPDDCQKLIDDIIGKGKGRTAESVYSILNITFKMAINHQLITINPLLTIVKEKHEKQHGKAFTRHETKELVKAFDSVPQVQKCIAMLLYCGLRPNELETVRVEGDFIVAKNSKRKRGKIEFKKIPILPQLRPYLDDFAPKPITTINRQFKKKAPDHKLYDLRTTFYTMCQEFGVAPPARDKFVGHSSNALTETYTDLSDEYLLDEAKKLHNKF